MSKEQIPGLKKFSVAHTSKARSCTPCRAKKRRCSRESPSCSSCRAFGLECSYEINPARSSPSLNLEEQAKILVELSSSSSLDPSTPRVISESQQFPQDAAKLSHFSVKTPPSILLNSFTQRLLIPIESKTEPVPSIPEAIRHDDVSPKEKRLSSRLSGSHLTDAIAMASKLQSQATCTAEEGPKFTSEPVMRAFWPLSANGQHGDIHPLLRQGPVLTNLFSSSLYNTGISLESDLKLLGSYLPDKKACDVLYDRYWYSIHPIIPILDSKNISPQYEMYWDDKATSSLPFYTILFSILYAASVSEYEEVSLTNDPKVNHKDYVTRMKYFVGATEIALSMSGFPWKVTIFGLQASVILHSVIRNDCRSDDCGSVGFLVRSAQLIELNRDPLSYHGITDPKEIQSRRLLWWQIFHLDCTTSLSSRLPPIIVDGEYDTSLPSKFIRDFNGVYKLDQAVAYANGTFKWVECCNKILRNGFTLKYSSTQTIKMLTEEINNLSIHCSSLIQNLLDPSNITPSLEYFVYFCTSMISTFADRCYILLHLILAFNENYKGELEGNRNNAYKLPDTSSVSDSQMDSLDKILVEKEIHLLKEFCNYGAMPKNIMFLWAIRKFQPIQTLLLLLRGLVLEIKKNGDPSWFSKRIAWRDPKIVTITTSIEKLGYLSDHATVLCKERWKLLRELKNATWSNLFPGTSDFSPLNPEQILQDDFASSENSEVLTEEDWNGVLLELMSVEQIINDNMYSKQWDSASGKFLI